MFEIYRKSIQKSAIMEILYFYLIWMWSPRYPDPSQAGLTFKPAKITFDHTNDNDNFAIMFVFQLIMTGFVCKGTVGHFNHF